MFAVILAAGVDDRLRPRTERTPKALLPVAGVPILRRTITALLTSGIEQIVIVTGHLEAQIRAAVMGWFPAHEIAFVSNPRYRETSTGSSLFQTKHHVLGQAFLIIDGDVVFDSRVIARLLDRGPDCVAVRSVGSLGAEDVKVTADANDRIVAIGKQLPNRGAMGESVGIASISATASRRLFAALDPATDPARSSQYYEAALQSLADAGTALFAVDIGSLYASEIDTESDLSAADVELLAHPTFDPRVGLRLAV
jgi:choline kinase